MILESEYPLSHASELLGVKPRTLQSWVQFMPSERVEGGGVKGSHRRFSFFALIQAATAQKLIALGVSASRAFEYAAEFANFGGMETGGWVGGPRPAMRNPSMPFHYALGDTYLCADASQAIVLRVPKGETLDAIVARSDLDGSAYIRLDMWPIFCGVVRKLSDDYRAPFALLDDAYGIHSEADLKEQEAR
ncbi:hypothetical protein AB9K41_07635 [Cribrihabitans sp. XS_ASV171]